MICKGDNIELVDSGIEWVGAVPATWNIFPAGGVFCEVKEKNTDGKYNTPFSFRYGEIVNKKIAGEIDKSIEETLNAYRVVAPDTIMINGLNLNYDFISQRVAIVRDNGIITSAYLAVKPDKNKVAPRFVLYLLKAYDYRQVFHGLGSGIRKTLKYQDFKNIKVVAPSLTEQEAIVSYLDFQCMQIDSIISDAKASIEEYKSWKASIIHEAVTKGLDPDAEMKDSGVKWIGEVPSSWRITKIRNFVSIRSGITLGKQYPVGTQLISRPYLRVANVKSEYLDLSNVATIMVTKEEAEKYALSPGELLMTEGGDRDKLGRGTIWNGEIPECLHQNHVFAVRVNEKFMLTEYLSYLTASPIGRVYFDITAKKTTNLASTNSTTILQFTVPVPSLEEQRKIVEMLNQKCASINEVIDEKQKLIDDLESYKKSLIFEVVTGKRRVV